MNDFNKITNLMELRELAIKLAKNINEHHDIIRERLTEDDSLFLDLADKISENHIQNVEKEIETRNI